MAGLTWARTTMVGASDGAGGLGEALLHWRQVAAAVVVLFA